MLLVEVGFLWNPRKRISWDPHKKMWFCGMVYYWCTINWVPLLTSQWPISICLAMENVLSCLQSGQHEGHCPDSPVLHPASLASVSSCSPFQAPSWNLLVNLHSNELRTEQASTTCKCRSQARHRTSLFPRDYAGFGTDRCFLEETKDSSNFYDLWMGLHPQVSPVTLLAPHQESSTGEDKGGVLIPLTWQFYGPLECKKL